MTRKFYLTLAVIAGTSFSVVTAQQTAEITPSGIGYLQYLPNGYHSNSKRYPVVISLHGIKEKGTSSTDRKRVMADLPKVDNVGLPKYVKQGRKFPFILISPQLKSQYGTWPPSFIIEVLNHVKKELRIDDRRIYLTGLSLGGLGVWKTAGAYPNTFAAIAPVCAGGNALSKAHAIANADLPVWSFHGSSDHVVPYTVTTAMVSAINRYHPKPLAKVTLFPHMGHIIWDRAYLETDLLDWMLRFKKGTPPPSDADKPHGDKDEAEESNEEQHAEESKKNNSAPVANAGPDRTLTLPSDALILQGKATDKDGKIKSWRWKQTSGASARLGGTSSPSLKIDGLRVGTYAFLLTVQDDHGATDTDEVRVTVKAATVTASNKDSDDDQTSPTNKNPENNKDSSDNKNPSDKADSSDHKTGSDSNKDTGKKPAADNKTSSEQKDTPDNKDTSNNDTSTANSNEENHTAANRVPIANAGTDRTVILPSNSISLHGQARDDDGRITAYQWTQVSGPAAVMRGASSGNVSVSRLQEGVYIFRLTVRDNRGGLGIDDITVQVRRRFNVEIKPTDYKDRDHSRELPFMHRYGEIRNRDVGM